MLAEQDTLRYMAAYRLEENLGHLKAVWPNLDFIPIGKLHHHNKV